MNKNTLLIGLGGAGCSVVEGYSFDKVNIILINTDKKSLERKVSYRKLLIGEKCLNGLGGGRVISSGQQAIDESFDDILLISKE